MAIDEGRMHAFMGKAVVDIGAALSACLVLVGDKLGLYKALAQGPATPAELAARTSTAERYVREWLANQAAGGYVMFDAATGTYSLTPEQAAALADESSPFLVAGGFDVVRAMYERHDALLEAFRTGKGISWGEQHPDLFRGTERFFRPAYARDLVGSWIPALDGVVAKLARGAKVADVGCGHGASTLIMAQAWPESSFTGFDFHPPSIETASRRAGDAGLGDRVRFDVARSTNYPGDGYDLVTFFDCLHDMGDPVGAARHVRSTLAENGTWMIVEPMAADAVEDNLNPIGRVFYAASTCICVPASLSENGPALGAQAGEARLRAILSEAGFTRVRRATETPFNMILEARA